MADTLGVHNLAAIIFQVAGIRIQGTGDEGIVIEAVTEDNVTTQVSADGDLVTVEGVNDSRWRARVSTFQTSAAYKNLHDLKVAQDAAMKAGTPAFNRRCFYKDPGTGDRVVANQCIIENTPPINGQKTAQTVEWRIILVSPTIARGASL